MGQIEINMKIGTKVKRQIAGEYEWRGKLIKKIRANQYGDCVVKWNIGPDHKNGTYEWESDLELD